MRIGKLIRLSSERASTPYFTPAMSNLKLWLIMNWELAVAAVLLSISVGMALVAVFML